MSCSLDDSSTRVVVKPERWEVWGVTGWPTNSLKMFCWQNGRAGNEAVWVCLVSLQQYFTDWRAKTLLENNTGPLSREIEDVNQPACICIMTDWDPLTPDRVLQFHLGSESAGRWDGGEYNTAQTGQMTLPDDSQRIEDHHYTLCLLQPTTPLPPSLLDIEMTGQVSEQAGGNKTNSSLTARPVMLSCQIFIERKTTVKIGFSPAKTSEIKKCKWNT